MKTSTLDWHKFMGCAGPGGGYWCGEIEKPCNTCILRSVAEALFGWIP